MFKSNIILHSNMVRFIIKNRSRNKILAKVFYIPIWLDLLLMYIKPNTVYGSLLHSNMVRFIIIMMCYNPVRLDTILHSNMVRFIIDYLTAGFISRQNFTFQYG